MKSRFFTCALLFVLKFALAQELPVITQEELEQVSETTEEQELEDDQFLQLLDHFTRHPLNLNTASHEDLAQLRFLSDLQISNFISYRDLLGKLIDLYELQAVPTFDIATIRKILPFVRAGAVLSEKKNLSSRFANGEHQVIVRTSSLVQLPRGYDTSLIMHYTGDRLRLMFRYRYQYKNLLQFGIVTDKDAGERFFSGAQSNGFDFYSVHLFARNIGVVKSVALGDYVVNLGQGLTQWQSFGFGKSGATMNIKRQAPVIAPYRSSGEFYFNRGGATTLAWKKFETTIFISQREISANRSLDSAEHFSSFSTSGYHRTPMEVADKNSIRNFSVGGNLSYRSSAFNFGVNFVAHQFAIPLKKRDEPYNHFALSGKRFINSSVDFSYTFRNAHLFGEVAVDRHLRRAVIAGGMISVDSKADFSFLFRDISKEYSTLFGNAFTAGTLPVNEKGIYAGFQLRPTYRWQLSGYADVYQFPFLRYRVNGPSSGADYLAMLEFHPDKKAHVYIRYRYSKKSLNVSEVGQPISFPMVAKRSSLRFHTGKKVTEAITVKTRLEATWYQHSEDSETGLLVYLEAAFKPSFRLSGNVRLQFFETSGYNSRVYVYERDVPFSVSIPAVFDKGFRYYINLGYDVTRNFSAFLRWSHTIYNNVSVIGSGLDEIRGNERSEWKVQILWRL